MIAEKPLGKKAARYADGVVSALTFGRQRPAQWDTVKKLIEASYFNGFQSGVVWQKQARKEEEERPFRVEIGPFDDNAGRVFCMEKAVTKNGHYIGDPKFANDLWKAFGITRFELRTKRSQVCSVGYSPTEKKWYGWSHRAIRGFKTRKAASKFAESVS